MRTLQPLAFAKIIAGALVLGSSLAASAQVTVRAVSTIRWGQSDGTLGLTGATLEDFEDVTLAPGLSVKWISTAGTVGPVTTLPRTFNPSTDDAFGNAFVTGQWDGTRGLVSGMGNQTYSYSGSTSWGGVELAFATPMKVVGFSVEQADREITVFINGTNVGGLFSLSSSSTNGGRNGYYVITATGANTISTIQLANNGGDGWMIDHLLFSPDPAPVVNVTGFPAEPWGRADTGFNMTAASVENFEDVNLVPGLSIGWDTGAGVVAPSSTLPRINDPLVDDTFGTSFRAGPWDGTHGVINTRDNNYHAYTGTQEWGDIIFRYNPPVQAVAFSLEQAEGPSLRFAINGRDIGELLPLAGLSPNSGRNGFIRIDTPCGGTPISELRLINNRQAIGGDGFMIDHMLIGTTVYFPTPPAPARTCPGVAKSFSVVAAPGGTFTYQWQIETSPGNWFTLGNDPGPLPGGGQAFATPINSANVNIGVLNRQGTFNVRAIATNSCGSAASAPASFTVGCTSIANIVTIGGGASCDDQLTADDVVAFLAGFFAQQPIADVARLGGGLGADGRWTADDVIAFLSAFFAGCP